MIGSPLPSVDPTLSWDNFRLCIDNGRKIEAIKILRAVASIGLKEAKDAVEAFEVDRNPAPIYKYFRNYGASTCPGCQLAFDNGTVVVMPATMEIKIDGVFTPAELSHLYRILGALDESLRL